VADKAGDLSKIFGGGSDAASGAEDEALGPELGLGGDDEEAEEADAPPPDFALNASEAFPELAGDDARLEALYRTIKSCHPVG
jgi:hypothetical protein